MAGINIFNLTVYCPAPIPTSASMVLNESLIIQNDYLQYYPSSFVLNKYNKYNYLSVLADFNVTDCKYFIMDNSHVNVNLSRLLVQVSGNSTSGTYYGGHRLINDTDYTDFSVFSLNPDFQYNGSKLKNLTIGDIPAIEQFSPSITRKFIYLSYDTPTINLIEFNYTQNYDKVASVENCWIDMPFPFGINGGPSTYLSSFIMLNSIYKEVYQGAITIGGVVIYKYLSYQPISIHDSSPPTILSMKVLRTTDRSQYLRIRIQDDYSGFYKIVLGRNTLGDEVFFNTSNLVLGSLLDATMDFSSFTYFEFDDQVETTNTSPQRLLRFNLTFIDTDFHPQLVVSWEGQKRVGYGSWNPDIQLYEIVFTLAKNMINSSLDYRLHYKSGYIEGIAIQSFFDPTWKTKLLVNSINGDYIPPIITSIISTLSGQSCSFTWNITIEDQTGFDNGTIIVKETTGLQTFSFDFNRNTRTSSVIYDNGNLYISKYSLCKEGINNFTITTIRLTDTEGNTGTYDSFYSDKYIVPLLSTSYNRLIGNMTIRYLYSSNANTTNYIFNPTITNLYLNRYSIDQFSNDRTVSIEISLESQFLLNTPPTFYLQSLNHPLLSCESYQTQQNTFKCDLTIPFGYGFEVAYISVYGITDIFKFYKGFNTIDLQQMNLPYKVLLSKSRFPSIVNYSPFTSTIGGNVTLTGVNLNPIETNQSFVYVLLPSGVNITLPVLSKASDYIVISMIPISSSVSLIYYVEDFYSNKITLTPYDILNPSQSPKPTPGCLVDKDCSLHGSCLNGTCQCEKGYYGGDCSNVIAPIAPSFNETRPSVIIDYQGHLSSIQIEYLREMSAINEVISTYNLTNVNWSVTNVSNELREAYQYSYNVSESTSIFVVLEWFVNGVNYSFIDDLYYIPPHSLKYTITFSPYQFKSIFNSLQLVMSSSIRGSSDLSQCNSNRGGSGSGEDHSEKELDSINLSINDQSLFGTFIRVGDIDKRKLSISNTIISKQHANDSIGLEIGINIPYFSQYAVLDPNFSLLLNTNPNTDQCNGNSASFALTKIQLIAVIVSASLFAAVIVIIVVIVIIKKRKLYEYNQRLQYQIEKADKYIEQ
ncbi:hypothetical protein PPL_10595 [Heterostelium album PN500]|uniref:EGF-like domain-containing protein n=1 Tax=Heterostelium pallidum (strain ATCC 26659 / Pp 5 / PN500) TaxID=670386 RepID=D3BRI4_HETP5|nr:hypothetical protein PPL_10595 [Heterostelium album PN500]EFA76016.1 hypothetical protein PPL_10595 [Heterostelium album PN500]|eukprot:XP_020428150.1 hypothetical protein PPL_10595 [Heterostelium album PN500]